MAKTAAERQRKRREKLKMENNRVDYEEHKRRDRERKKLAKLLMLPKEKENLQTRTREAVRQHRMNNSQIKVVDWTVVGGTPYKSLSSLGKAKSRVMKALPKSPHKRASLVKLMACDILGTYIAAPKIRTNQEIVEAVISSYENENISRMMPGKADFITLKDQLGNKYTKQKRHLVATITETYKCFTEDNPSADIGKSKFASLRPRWVLLSSEMPHNVCGCKYHRYVILLLEALHRRYPDLIPLYSKENFIAHCVCDINDEDCMRNGCERCSDGKLFKEIYGNKAPADNEFSWYQLEDTIGFLQKVKQSGNSTDAFEELAMQLPKFNWHLFIKEKQSSSYQHMKISSEDTSEECLLQMDFAENFTCIWQDEIQSAHWKQRQVTIYTIMITYRNKKLSFVIISDFLSHEKTAVAAFTSTILDIITDNFPTVRTVDVWTDGGTVKPDQHAVRIRWNYFATSHGKGLKNDGIGGNAKRIVHRLIMSRSAVVSDSQSFANALRSSGTSINVVELTEDDIKEKCKMFDVETLCSGLQTFPGIISTHCAQSVGNGMVQLKFFTTDPSPRHVPAKYTKEAVEVSRKSDENWNCTLCKWKYGDKADPKISEEWIMCASRQSWFHESCGQQNVKSVCKNKSELVKIAMT
ncbi:hypothetical protein LOTGIDRAFT_160697 [Lottia gigantea]|uniref:Zinc finger PHD-type domain-containing protein n=1 Tax=Lottia gigantea TaxID=225164 RepID=V3ZVJ4_LOTGI|nr:hypothetical protein LOTGIDRAFT_160697 [Lottia gigantea]ESO95533.1 hypothetical protein LOTGIDRAFT_160697 [Lottia gigantea]